MDIIGLMSGTSADGIDACLARIDECDGHLLASIAAFLTVPYPDDLRRRVLDVQTVEDVCRLNMELGERFAQAALAVCKKAGVRPESVDAVGSHGQTICHLTDPPRATLQIGEPCVIAERTGIATVADFRPRDVAAGGSGAPLVPVVDHLLLGEPGINRVALNIGGIANVTILKAGGAIEEVLAFDTGPGNMVVDGLVAGLTDGAERCDTNGGRAAEGQVIGDLLGRLLQDAYYALTPPKSAGREQFGQPFAEGLLSTGRACGLRDQDIVATATALTAHSIAQAVTQWGFPDLDGVEVVVSGGGVHNATLMGMLQEAMPGAHILPSDDLGIPADAKEALAFAVLAWLTLHDRPGNLPGATGASAPAILGKIVPKGA